MFFLVPHAVTSTSVTLWVAAADEALPPHQLRLVPNLPGQNGPTNAGQWPLGTSQPRLRHHHIVVEGLAPRQAYSFALMRGATQVADAKVKTLPAEMPVEGEGRFSVLLGSCFARLEDRDGHVAQAFRDIPQPDRPDVKIFSGDQVYLDSPALFFTIRTHDVEVLHEKFFDHYKLTWGNPKGLATVLRDGANFFCSDDHEFWNNAPNRAPHLQDTFTSGNRQAWWDAALQLYSAFQNAQPIQTFEVPPVSFLIADTRMNRSRDETNFMLEDDLHAVEDWIRGLKGPGVLVIGQPLLQTSTGFFAGHFLDWNLPDYTQYKKLTTIIGGSRHSLVILTGDVHYGRIASSPLRSNRNVELIEIISSPMSLVDPSVKGKWEKAPERTAPAALAPTGMLTQPGFEPNDSHFLTLEFSRRGVGANMKIRYWPIAAPGTAPRRFRDPVWEKALA